MTKLNEPPRLEAAKVCYASLAHASPEDEDLLKAVCAADQFEHLVAYEHCCGYFIFLDACLPENGEGFVDSLLAFGFSKPFITLMTEARIQGFEHMYLRRDVKPHPAYYVFDWSDVPDFRALDYKTPIPEDGVQDALVSHYLPDGWRTIETPSKLRDMENKFILMLRNSPITRRYPDNMPSSVVAGSIVQVLKTTNARQHVHSSYQVPDVDLGPKGRLLLCRSFCTACVHSHTELLPTIWVGQGHMVFIEKM